MVELLPKISQRGAGVWLNSRAHAVNSLEQVSSTDKALGSIPSPTQQINYTSLQKTFWFCPVLIFYKRFYFIYVYIGMSVCVCVMCGRSQKKMPDFLELE